MNFPMAVGANEDTFIGLGFHFCPRACDTALGHAERFWLVTGVVKVEYTKVTFETAEYALTAFVLHKHFLEFPPPLGNSLLQIFRTVCIGALIFLSHGIHRKYTTSKYLTAPVPCSAGRIRTYNQLLNRELHYRCATAEHETAAPHRMWNT